MQQETSIVPPGSRAAKDKETVKLIETAAVDYFVEKIIAGESLDTRLKVQGRMTAALTTSTSAAPRICFPNLGVLAVRLTLPVPLVMGTVTMTMTVNLGSNVATTIVKSSIHMLEIMMVVVSTQILRKHRPVLHGGAAHIKIPAVWEEETVLMTTVVRGTWSVVQTIVGSSILTPIQKWTVVCRKNGDRPKEFLVWDEPIPRPTEHFHLYIYTFTIDIINFNPYIYCSL